MDGSGPNGVAFSPVGIGAAMKTIRWFNPRKEFSDEGFSDKGWDGFDTFYIKLALPCTSALKGRALRSEEYNDQHVKGLLGTEDEASSIADLENLHSGGAIEISGGAATCMAACRSLQGCIAVEMTNGGSLCKTFSAADGLGATELRDVDGGQSDRTAGKCHILLPTISGFANPTDSPAGPSGANAAGTSGPFSVDPFAAQPPQPVRSEAECRVACAQLHDCEFFAFMMENVSPSSGGVSNSGDDRGGSNSGDGSSSDGNGSQAVAHGAQRKNQPSKPPLKLRPICRMGVAVHFLGGGHGVTTVGDLEIYG